MPPRQKLLTHHHLLNYVGYQILKAESTAIHSLIACGYQPDDALRSVRLDSLPADLDPPTESPDYHHYLRAAGAHVSLRRVYKALETLLDDENLAALEDEYLATPDGKTRAAGR